MLKLTNLSLETSMCSMKSERDLIQIDAVDGGAHRSC